MIASFPRGRGDQPRQQVPPNGDGGDVKSGRAAFPPTHVTAANSGRDVGNAGGDVTSGIAANPFHEDTSKGADRTTGDANAEPHHAPKDQVLQRARLRRDAARGQVQPTPRSDDKRSHPGQDEREGAYSNVLPTHGEGHCPPNPKIRKWCAGRRVPSVNPAQRTRERTTRPSEAGPRDPTPPPRAKSRQAGVSRAVQRVRMSPPGGGGRHQSLSELNPQWLDSTLQTQQEQ